MAKLKFNKQKSLEEGEIVLDLAVETQEPEIVTANEVKPEQEPINVPMEIKVSANSEPTAKELQLAKELSGTPRSFDSEHQSILESLARYGIAADFNGDWGRGHKWHIYCK